MSNWNSNVLAMMTTRGNVHAVLMFGTQVLGIQICVDSERKWDRDDIHDFFFSLFFVRSLYMVGGLICSFRKVRNFGILFFI